MSVKKGSEQGSYIIHTENDFNKRRVGKNKSFISGHAAMGGYLMVLAWVFRSRFWMLMGIFTGLVASLGRIVQGGHFLSEL